MRSASSSRPPTAPPAEILSPRNPRIARVARLHETAARRETGRMLLEGPLLLEEALSAGLVIEDVFLTEGDDRGAALAARSGAAVSVVSPEVLRRLSTTTTPRSPVAVAVVPAPRRPPAGAALVLWGISDPGNAGTILRTASAFGMAVLSTGTGVDPFSPKMLRAAAGAQLRNPVYPLDPPDPDILRTMGHRVVATVPAGGTPLWAAGLGPDPAFLIGSEPHGLPTDVIGAADLVVSVPMAGPVESLNAAVAAALCAYEWVRRASRGRD